MVVIARSIAVGLEIKAGNELAVVALMDTAFVEHIRAAAVRGGHDEAVDGYDVGRAVVWTREGALLTSRGVLFSAAMGCGKEEIRETQSDDAHFVCVCVCE